MPNLIDLSEWQKRIIIPAILFEEKRWNEKIIYYERRIYDLKFGPLVS